MSKGVLAIVLILVGFFGFAALTRETNAPNGQFIPGIGGGPGDVIVSPEPSETRIRLESLLTQHGTLGSTHLENVFDGKGDSNIVAQLESNTQQIVSQMVEYGAPRDEFNMMWRGHMSEYENYTEALKNNDRVGTDLARRNLGDHSVHMGAMINQLFPSLPVDQVKDLMNEHIDLTLSIIEAHSRGDSDQKLANMDKATDQAVRFASVLANAIQESNTQVN
jgi:hypothetical protein